MKAKPAKPDPNEPKLSVETLSVETLIPYARNSRTHSEEQVAQIAGSIREFGFTNPVLIDADNGIIAGHGRVMAARKLGLFEVPCIRLGHLTEAQRRAYVIADNKLALNAGWDEELLKLELAELRDASFDLNLTGFSSLEIEAFLIESDKDIEPIESEEEESTSGSSVDYLKIGKYEIPLEKDEVNGLLSVIQSYGEENGTTFGFGRFLLRQIEK